MANTFKPRRLFRHASAYSVCLKEPQNRFEPDALLADECHGVDFSTRIVSSLHYGRRHRCINEFGAGDFFVDHERADHEIEVAYTYPR
jgi:hypothetical protein